MTAGYRGYLVFRPAPEEGLEEDEADFGGSELFDGAGSADCADFALDSCSFVLCLTAGFESSGGISKELMSSPGSARTAILDPTWTPLVPSA